MRFFTTAFLSFLLSFSSAQTMWYHYNWDAVKPNEFGPIYENILSYNLTKYKDNLYIGQFYKRFAEEIAFDINNDIINGNIYKLPAEHEAYLYKILREVVKDTGITNKIKIMVYRDHTLNASMDGSGIMRLNIGALAAIDTEAELAMLMAHEVAHFVNDDMVKNYGRNIETLHTMGFAIKFEFYIGFEKINFGKIDLFNPAHSYFWNNRAQESSADFKGINFMKTTNYSLKTGSSLFRKFKRTEIREEIMFGKGDKMFKTHPDPGERLKQVRLFSADSLNGGKRNFIVDSLEFAVLKELALQETTNIRLLENDLSSLSVQTFSKYLIEPDNSDNLSVLIESIRRIIAKYKKINAAEKPFILFLYQSDAAKKSSNYAFLNEKSPSILNYLSKGFIDIWKENVKKIKAADLLDSTVTEFTSNAEAYEYFKKKAEELKNKKATHYKFFGEKPDFSSVNEYVQNNDLFETNDFLNEKGELPDPKKDIFILLPTELRTVSEILKLHNLEEKRSFDDKICEAVKKHTGAECLKYSDLPMSAKHRAAELADNAASELLPKPNTGITKKEINWLEFAPELYSLFKNNSAKNIFFCKVEYENEAGNNKKTLEKFEFYKVSLPKHTNNSYCGQLLTENIDLNEDVDKSLEKLGTQFNVFYKLTKD